MYFQVKKILKNNRYHILKYSSNTSFLLFILSFFFYVVLVFKELVLKILVNYTIGFILMFITRVLYIQFFSILSV
jgi:hypothetical protein